MIAPKPFELLAAGERYPIADGEIVPVQPDLSAAAAQPARQADQIDAHRPKLGGGLGRRQR